MKYETNNLDEAAYLALQGYEFSVTRTASVSARFEFVVDAAFEDIRKHFWKGDATIQLHRWLATRAALKNEVKGQPVRVPHVPTSSIAPTLPEVQFRVGDQYWYRDGDTIKAAMFGKNAIHSDRLARGNFYRSREEAKLKARGQTNCSSIKFE